MNAVPNDADVRGTDRVAVVAVLGEFLGRVPATGRALGPILNVRDQEGGGDGGGGWREEVERYRSRFCSLPPESSSAHSVHLIMKGPSGGMDQLLTLTSRCMISTFSSQFASVS